MERLIEQWALALGASGALALFVTLVTPACSGSRASAGASPVLAKVGDTDITVADVETRLDEQSPFLRARYGSPEKKKELLDEMVRFEVLAAEAKRRGYDRDPSVLRAEKEAMVSTFLAHEFDSKLSHDPVSDAAVESYYSAHADEFHRKDAVRASEIVVRDRERAGAIASAARASTSAGADKRAFADLALKNSHDAASRARGGDVGFIERDTTQLPKAVVDAAFSLAAVGDVSDPIPTDGGFVILMLVERRPGFDRPLSDVKDDIRERLSRGERPRAFETFVAELAKDARVVKHEENLGQVRINGGARLARPSLPPDAVSARDRGP